MSGAMLLAVVFFVTGGALAVTARALTYGAATLYALAAVFTSIGALVAAVASGLIPFMG